MYLHEFKDQGTVYAKIRELASKYDLTVEKHNMSGCITASIRILGAGHTSILSEFPGNCSSLVLSDVQNGFYRENGLLKAGKWVANTIDVAISICLALQYGALFISGTTSEMREYLINNYGFIVVMDDLMNPHSGHMNYYLAKLFKYPEDEPYIEDLEEEDLEEEDLEEDYLCEDDLDCEVLT